MATGALPRRWPKGAGAVRARRSHGSPPGPGGTWRRFPAALDAGAPEGGRGAATDGGERAPGRGGGAGSGGRSGEFRIGACGKFRWVVRCRGRRPGGAACRVRRDAARSRVLGGRARRAATPRGAGGGRVARGRGEERDCRGGAGGGGRCARPAVRSVEETGSRIPRAPGALRSWSPSAPPATEGCSTPSGGFASAVSGPPFARNGLSSLPRSGPSVASTCCHLETLRILGF